MCIGSRYALMEGKLLLFFLFSRFSIEKSPKTPEKLEFKASGVGFKQLIHLNFVLRK